MNGRVAPIRSEADYGSAMARINALLAQEVQDRDEADELEVLTVLADDWENRSFEDPDVSPARILRFLIESNGITPSEVAATVGSTVSRIYEYLNEKRSISDAVAIKLGERFGVQPKLFKTVRDSRKAS